MNAERCTETWQSDRGLRVSSRVSPVGIDIGDHSITAAQLGGARNAVATLRAGLVLERRESGPISRNEAIDLALALRRAGFEGREVIVGAPDDRLIKAQLELPPRTSSAPLDDIACSEMSRLHRLEPESFAMAYWDLPGVDRSKSGPNAMGLGLPEQVSAQIVHAMNAGGLDVVGIDARMCALSRACVAGIGNTSGLVALVEVGWSQTQVMLLHCAGGDWTIVFERRITEASVKNVVDALTQRIGIDVPSAIFALRDADPEDVGNSSPEYAELMRVVRQQQNEFFDVLAPEVQRSIAYASQRYSSMPLCGGYMCGEGALMRGLRGRLAHELSLECAPIACEDIVRLSDESVLGRECELLCAIGLAAYEPRHVSARERSAA